jgi:methionyl-tRNA formyltransferase
MCMKLRILLIAEQSAGIQTLRLLADMSHTVVAVVAAPPRSTEVYVPNVWTVAQSLGFSTWPAKLIKTAEFSSLVQGHSVDLIAVGAPGIGAFNLHPGPLPRYAGLNPVSWAIYRGETLHGVTIHRMLPEVDAGPIAYQTLFPVRPTDSGFAVSARCTREGMVLLKRLLETASISPDHIPAMPQDLSKREYFGKNIPENGSLSWSRPAKEILDFVRACDFHPFVSPWGNPRTVLDGIEVAIAKATLTGSPAHEAPGTMCYDNGVLQVAASDEWVGIHKLITEGRLVGPASLFSSNVRSVAS